jgi:hypothetical protein
MIFRFFITAIVIAFGLSGCADVAPQPKGPSVTATLVPDNGKNSGISFKQVLNIANNSSELSCIELTLGSLQANALTSISNPRIVKASDATRALAGAVGRKATVAIDKELLCHCDRGAAMPGYEIFERRQHLQKNKKNRSLNASLTDFYPKDTAGKPRFLEPGEKLSKATLNKLPLPLSSKRFDDCGRSCKAARKRTNASAVAAGKPEPYPNLQYPLKKSCKKR